jgi:hypothetical protein
MEVPQIIIQVTKPFQYWNPRWLGDPPILRNPHMNFYDMNWYELVWIDSYTLLWKSLSNHQRHGVFLRRAVTPWWKIERQNVSEVNSVPSWNLYAKVSMESKRITLVEYQWINGIYIYVWFTQQTSIGTNQSGTSHSFFALSLTLNVCLFVC